MLAAVLIGLFFLFLMLAVPIGFAMGLATAVAIGMHETLPMTLLAQRSIVGAESYALLAIPFFGWGLASVKMIAIERQSTIDSLKKVTDQGKDRLARGISVIVFPEGTRSHPDDLLPFQIGGAFLAVKCNALVLPVTHNAGRVWPKGAFLKGPGTITVVIGKAIDPAGLRAQALNKMIELRIREQLAETERG